MAAINPKQLKTVKDGGQFRLSLRSKVFYKVIKKVKGKVMYTSLSSEKSFWRPSIILCYPVK